MVLILLISLIGGVLNAATIVSVQSANLYTGGFNVNVDQTQAVSWRSTNSYTGVSISIQAIGIPGVTTTGTAYLTNSIGPGTTNTNLVAAPSSFVVDFTGRVYTQGPITVFSGLTLGPGTYFLVISSTAPDFNSGFAWASASHAQTVVTAPGVDRGVDRIGTTQGLFAPAYNFQPSLFFESSPLAYIVTGDVNTSNEVPEPSSGALCVCAVGGPVFLRMMLRAFRKPSPEATRGHQHGVS